MSKRRFTDKPELAPSAVWSLPEHHPALVENRSLFPSTVVTVDDEFDGRLLVSGENNRKLGAEVMKGRFKGYALYGLSLEERATCPDDCNLRAVCYGNSMHQARRHRIGDSDLFFTFLENEVREIFEGGAEGLLVRLHVLGDFPSVEYVAFWADMLEEHPNLACYGYTHRKTTAWGGDEIGDAIEALKDREPDRFRIRWSSHVSRPDGAVVISEIPATPRTDAGIVCPAQTDATACCSTCGLCWEPSAATECIAFVKHGPKSIEQAATSAREASPAQGGARPVAPVEIPSSIAPADIPGTMPEVRIVNPVTLKIEDTYQRDLSAKSLRLIHKIVREWDWTKFKPPVCADAGDGLVVIDGQHTAIAAASHPGIKEIPVMVVAAARVEARASAFVAHNRDRLNMTTAQVFFGEVAAGDPVARGVMDVVVKTGCSIPRLPVARGSAKPGQITAIRELKMIYSEDGADHLEKILRMIAAAKIMPLTRTIIRGLRMVLTDPSVANLPEDRIVAALRAPNNLEAMARKKAAIAGFGPDRACALLIAERMGKHVEWAPVAQKRDITDAEERLEQLEEALRDSSWIPFDWGLTGAQVEIMNVLYRRRLATKEAICTVLYGDDPDGGADPKIVDVQICKMRALLEPHGIEILTVWGQGYALSDDTRQKVSALKALVEGTHAHAG